MRVKFGNGFKDVGILEVTAENYIVPQGEEGHYHCRIEQRHFNADTGKRLSIPQIQKFEPKMWDMISRNLRQQGWTIEVLYDPTEYLKQGAEVIEQQKKQAAAAAKAKERDELKKEILAELQAAGFEIKPKKENKPRGGKKKEEPKTDGAEKK